METASNLVADAKPDWARLLPPEVLFELMRVLHAALPPPLGEALATIAPRPSAAGSLPKFRQFSPHEIEARKTCAETTSGQPLTNALPGASGAGFGAEPHAC